MPTEPTPPATDPLGDPALLQALADFVRRRVPASDVDDVVQTVLVEALVSKSRPRDPNELRRWALGIARHKVVDLHRRVTREPPTDLPDLEASPPPVEERALARWAEEQAGSAQEAQKTLAWMAREGEGEKLEAIAAEEQVPAARVRQRVSRMRRWMKERWTAELAAVAMLGLLALAAWWLLHTPTPDAKAPDVPPTIAPEPASPLERARVLRADAFEACERGAWQPCLDGLDRARELDLVGDGEAAVGAARARAQAGLRAANPETTAVPGPKTRPQSTSAPLPPPPSKDDAGEKAPTKGGPTPTKPSYEGKPDFGGKSDATPSSGGGSGKQTGSVKKMRAPKKAQAQKRVFDDDAF